MVLLAGITRENHVYDDYEPGDRCFCSSVLDMRGQLYWMTSFGGALRVSGIDFQGENPRSDLLWLYLTLLSH